LQFPLISLEATPAGSSSVTVSSMPLPFFLSGTGDRIYANPLFEPSPLMHPSFQSLCRTSTFWPLFLFPKPPLPPIFPPPFFLLLGFHQEKGELPPLFYAYSISHRDARSKPRALASPFCFLSSLPASFPHNGGPGLPLCTFF